MSLRLRCTLCLCLIVLLAGCSTVAPQPVAPALPTARPAGITPIVPPAQTTSAPANSLSIPGASPEIVPVRVRVSQTLADAPKMVNFPVWAPDPAVLGDGSAFAQIAVYEGHKSDSDPRNPVRVGNPLVELIYRSSNGYWLVYQGMGSANDFKWRFPYFGYNYEEGTLRGQKAWFSAIPGSNEGALYWEEAGRVIVIGGRYSRPDYIKIAESMKPVP